MSCPHIASTSLQPPTPAQSVYREDCTQCFDSIDDPAGLDVCLQCFNGGCAGDRHHAKLHDLVRGHPLALNIRRTRKQIVRDEPPPKMSKLAIAAETEADRYDTAVTVKCLDCDQELDRTDEKLAPVVGGILSASTFARREEVKAWQQELTSCEHILTLQQSEARSIASQDLGHCSQCELNENLWLCMQCGNLGCGRAQFGGVGGNSHGLAHATDSGHGVAVKLGSITPEGNADVYCYTCDEERIDESLGQHLAHWGIILAERQKTEKNLTEMQIEQNLRWDFSMTSEDGKELKPLFGPGLTGLKNLGNSCYLASILQCLYDLPSFQKRYGAIGDDLSSNADPAQDLETQLRKIGDGLLSGRYSKPDSDATASENTPELPYQKGLAPAMLKHLIGRGHEEFSTMRQQDAFELLQHLIKLITRSKHPSAAEDPTLPFRFILEQRLQCLGCNKVRYTTNEQDCIFIDVPMEKQANADGNEGGGEASPAAYKSVTLKNCFDRLTGEELVELTCAACGSKDGYTKRSLFKTLPEVFVVNARKITYINWVPVKVNVPVIVDDAPFLMDEYLSEGLQPDEELLPEDATASSSSAGGPPAFVASAEAVAQLEAMGFPRVRCDKALHATGNSDANAAMEWLFVHMDDADIDEPLVLASAGSQAPTADPAAVEMLMSMGFSEPQAKRGLRETGGDVERAIEWVFSHPDATTDDDGEAETVAESGDKVVAGSYATPAKYQLQSIVCHKGTSIHAGHYVAFIRKKLTQDEDKLSWVLFNDEKVVEVVDVEEMKESAYIYFFKRV